MLYTSGFVDDVMFPMTYGLWHWQYLRERRAAASSDSHKFPTYSPGGATLFDFVVVYNGSKLCTRGVSDDAMRAAAIGWWPAACGKKAQDEVCFLRLPC